MSSLFANRLLFCATRKTIGIQNAMQVLPRLQFHSNALYPISENKNFGFNKDEASKESWSNLSEKVNSQLKENSTGRLFAVILAAGKQRKITQEDVIILDNNDMKVEIGDKIVLNKVLLVGGSDFTLIGRPLLRPDVIRVEATVIEKTTSHPKICFWYKRRKNFRFFKVRKDFLTYLRITDIKFCGLPNSEDQ